MEVILMDKGFGIYVTEDNDISVADINERDVNNSFILVNSLGKRLYFNLYDNGMFGAAPCPHFMVYALPDCDGDDDKWIITDSLNPDCVLAFLRQMDAPYFANWFLGL